MKDLPPPSFDLEFWILVSLAVLVFAAIVAYLVWFSRHAYIGGRYIKACGGYKAAARHLIAIEDDNEARLSGALSIHAFTKDKQP